MYQLKTMAMFMNYMNYYYPSMAPDSFTQEGVLTYGKSIKSDVYSKLVLTVDFNNCSYLLVLQGFADRDSLGYNGTFRNTRLLKGDNKDFSLPQYSWIQVGELMQKIEGSIAELYEKVGRGSEGLIELDSLYKMFSPKVNDLTWYGSSVLSALRELGFELAQYRNLPYVDKGWEKFRMEKQVFEDIRLAMDVDVWHDDTLRIDRMYIYSDKNRREVPYSEYRNICSDRENVCMISHLYKKVDGIFSLFMETLREKRGYKGFADIYRRISAVRAEMQVNMFGRKDNLRYEIESSDPIIGLNDSIQKAFHINREWSDRMNGRDYASYVDRYSDCSIFIHVIRDGSIVYVKCGVDKENQETFKRDILVTDMLKISTANVRDIMLAILTGFQYVRARAIELHNCGHKFDSGLIKALDSKFYDFEVFHRENISKRQCISRTSEWVTGYHSIKTLTRRYDSLEQLAGSYFGWNGKDDDISVESETQREDDTLEEVILKFKSGKKIPVVVSAGTRIVIERKD